MGGVGVVALGIVQGSVNTQKQRCGKSKPVCYRTAHEAVESDYVG